MAFPELYMPNGYGLNTFVWDCADTNYNATCTFGFRNLAGMTAQDANQLFQDIWAGSGRPASQAQTSDQWTLRSAYTLIQGPTYQTSYDDPINITGTGDSGSVPAGNSLVVSKKTPYAGRSNRGRFAWPPLNFSEEDVDAGGNINGAVISVLQGRFDAAFDEMVTSNMPMVLLHTRATADTEPTPTLVSNLIVQSVLGVQRRRMRR